MIKKIAILFGCALAVVLALLYWMYATGGSSIESFDRYPELRRLRHMSLLATAIHEYQGEYGKFPESLREALTSSNMNVLSGPRGCLRPRQREGALGAPGGTGREHLKQYAEGVYLYFPRDNSGFPWIATEMPGVWVDSSYLFVISTNLGARRMPSSEVELLINGSIGGVGSSGVNPEWR